MASGLTLALLAAGCSSPVTDTPASGSAITSLSPGSGPVGTRVTIHGSGFDATGNTVSFTAGVVQEPGQMPSEPGVIPGLTSADGRSIQVTYHSTNAEGQTNVTQATYERQ